MSQCRNRRHCGRRRRRGRAGDGCQHDWLGNPLRANDDETLPIAPDNQGDQECPPSCPTTRPPSLRAHPAPSDAASATATSSASPTPPTAAPAPGRWGSSCAGRGSTPRTWPPGAAGACACTRTACRRAPSPPTARSATRRSASREVARLRLKLEHAEKLLSLQKRMAEMMEEIDRQDAGHGGGRQA